MAGQTIMVACDGVAETVPIIPAQTVNRTLQGNDALICIDNIQ